MQQTWASGPFWIASVREYSSGKAGGVSYANLPFQWRVAGFGYGQLTTPSGLGPTLTAHVYLMPHAFAAIVFGAAPLWWLVGLRPHTRRARLAAGLCAECGYDLRASADRCPECGAANPRAI